MPTSPTFTDTAEPYDPENASLSPSLPWHPIAPTDERIAHILRLLEGGFLTDSKRFRQLEADLNATLHRARNLGSEYGSPDDWNDIWRRRWDNVASILKRIHHIVGLMDDAFDSNEKEQLTNALASWESLQTEDAQLVDALSDLHTQALALNPTAREEWTQLTQTLQMHVETVHSCSQALRTKLELMKLHTKQEVDDLVQVLIAKLPSRIATATASATADAKAAEYAKDYDQAVIELQEEQHQSLGLLDTIMTMFMWMESPEERIKKNRSQRVDSV